MIAIGGAQRGGTSVSGPPISAPPPTLERRCELLREHVRWAAESRRDLVSGIVGAVTAVLNGFAQMASATPRSAVATIGSCAHITQLDAETVEAVEAVAAEMNAA